MACLVALTQSIASTIIFIRRMEHGDYLIADVLNGIAAFSGAVTNAASLLLLIMRFKWEVIRPVQRERLVRQEIAVMASQLMLACLYIFFLRWNFFFVVLYSILHLKRAFDVVTMGAFVCVFRKAIFKRVGVPLKWAQSAILLAVFCVAAADVGILISGLIMDLMEADNGGWKDPLSDRLLVI
jgi:hypothetical protein